MEEYLKPVSDMIQNNPSQPEETEKIMNDMVENLFEQVRFLFCCRSDPVALVVVIQ